VTALVKRLQFESIRLRRRWRVTPVVVVGAVIVGISLTAGTAAGQHRASTAASAGPAACQTKIVGERDVLPPVVVTDAPPENALLSTLGTLRQPATAGDHIDLSGLDRWPFEIASEFEDYVRVVAGTHGARVAILPVSFCQYPGGLPSSNEPPPRLVEAVVMQILSNPSPRPTLLVGTPSEIRSGATFSGEFVSGVGLLATVVPDGVARVYMHFTPPFQRHYSVTETIHDNVGIARSGLPEAPTTIVWYDQSGHRIKTIIHRQEIALDNCLAHHRKDESKCLSIKVPSAR
jgi:hypothetical protein